jgi:amino acid adenylation domain-containing protein
MLDQNDPRSSRSPGTAPNADAPDAPAKGRDDAFIFDTSYAQQRLWFLDQLEPGSWVYNVPAAVRVSGGLDVGALRAALDEVVRRHEALRTTFASVEGRPMQVIAASGAVGLRVVDLGDIEEGEREDRVREEIAAEARRPFDLVGGPLVRASLLRVAAQEHVLLVTLHHIVSDGWSMGVLIREVGALYDALKVGKTSPLPELPIQYADFASWQREWLSGERLEQQLGYWRERLKGAPGALDLPTDRLRPAARTHRGARHAFTLPVALTGALRRVSREQRGTLFMTLLAGLKVLLHRYTGQTDLCVGTPIANRIRAEVEELIGFFVNTLVMRTDVAGNPTFGELVGRVRETAVAAYAHQDVPFERVVEELKPARDLSSTPFFQVMLVLQNARITELELSGATLTAMEVDSGTSKFDLTLEVTERGDELACVLEYSTDLFARATVERMGRHLRRLLESAVAHPEAGIGDIELMDDAERELVVGTYGGHATEYPRDATIAELFEAEAARCPDAVALSQGERTVTYRALDAAANRLAWRLRQAGVEGEALVCVGLERSIEYVTAVLAILKAGGAYVPLDATYPDERLRFMVEDTGARVIVADGALRTRVAAPGLRVVSPREVEEGAPDTPPPRSTTASSLAYVMYTSGTTGTPKGVCIEQRGVVRLVRGADYASLGRDEVFLLHSALTFDASTFELWAPLLNGGRLAILEPQSTLVGELSTAVARHRVTTLFVSAGLFHLVVDECPEGLRGLRQLIAGGDVLSPRHVDRARRLGCRVVNGYGPTENTTFTCCHVVGADEPLDGSVPIGRPIANTTVYLLDDAMRPAPIGVPGQLYTGGDGLARGYWNRSALTAERFVVNAISPAGGRLYATGDLARRRADGTIEFLGRRDQQVKVRGFRIELGEIEAALALHGAVREVVVMAREDEPGDKRLVAYHVATRGVAASELRGFLKEKLPEYMVPAAFEQLEALPLTPNGKVDRKALPAPQSGRSGLEVAFVAPRTPAEEALARIWSEVLGIAGVGVEDNFFELGGHSLLATQVVSRVRRALDVELPLRALFERPTIAALAELAQLLGSGPAGGASAVARVSREFPLPLSFAQEDFWFRSKTLRDASSNVPLAVRLEGEIDLTRLDRVATMLLGRHEGLRARFVELDGVPRQIVREPWVFCIPLVDVSSVPDAEREKEAARVLRAFAADPIRADSDVLFRLLLVRLGTRQHVLAATVHHMVVDAASLDVLRREFADLYASPECEAALPTLHLQYADFAAWEREHLGEEERGRRLSYWKARLAAPYPVLRLPTDRPRPPVRAYTAVTHAVRWGPDLARAVNGSARALRVTPFTVLLAAYQALLHRYTRQDDVLVGVPMSNRSHEGAEGVVGLFVHPAVIRCRFREDATGRQIVRAVADELAGAYAHPAPNRELLAAVAADPARGYSQIYQTYFAYQSLPECAPGQNGLRTSPWNSFGPAPTAMDLGVSIFHGASSLLVTMDYASELFTSAHIAAMADDFRGAIELVTWQPDAPLTDISVSASTPVPA